MSHEQIANIILKYFPELKTAESCGLSVFTIPDSKITEVALWLKSNPDLHFDMLVCETAVDYKTHLELLYHLTSVQHRHNLVLKTVLEDILNPEIESVATIWKSAEMFECEIFDLFGIKFLNHPNLRRLFMPDDWIGYPLRKDFDANKVEIGQ